MRENHSSFFGTIQSRSFPVLCGAVLLLHVALMFFRFGSLPPAPVLGDEVIINDPAVALSRGAGLVASSFTDSAFGIDKIYAHFPPLFPLTQSLFLRAFGVSVYSLRLGNTLADIAAAALFAALLCRLCTAGMARWGVAAAALLLYGLNAPLLIIHRMARMEPLLDLLLIAGLYLLLPRLYAVRENHHRRLALMFAGAIVCGAALAVHPEALLEELTVACVLLYAADLPLLLRAALVAVQALTPAIIWMLAFRARSLQALHLMGRILRYNTPQPSLFRYLLSLLRTPNRTPNSLMRASLIALWLGVAGTVLLEWLRREREARTTVAPSPQAVHALRLARAFAVSAIAIVLLLMFAISASASRYDPLLPLFLLATALCVPAAEPPRTPSATPAVIAWTVVQVAAVLFILVHGPRGAAPTSAHRYDAILAGIPPGYAVAATPALWLAFMQQGRPVTMLYQGFDGWGTWSRENPAAPLARFPVIVADSSRAGEYAFYSPIAAQGRRKETFAVGSDHVDIYYAFPATH